MRGARDEVQKYNCVPIRDEHGFEEDRMAEARKDDAQAKKAPAQNAPEAAPVVDLSLIHISEPTRP